MSLEMLVYVAGAIMDLVSTNWFLKRGGREGSPWWRKIIELYGRGTFTTINAIVTIVVGAILALNGIEEGLAWIGVVRMIVAGVNWTQGA